ncbi:hypothetical protein V1264_003343 [Littorina saxatilis]|uniref:Uncharacterized protein n=1 Tax=Littorina saxatilis TaxID=31220 RepID=A0AAN9B4R3_9CAEN
MTTQVAPLGPALGQTLMPTLPQPGHEEEEVAARGHAAGTGDAGQGRAAREEIVAVVVVVVEGRGETGGEVAARKWNVGVSAVTGRREPRKMKRRPRAGKRNAADAPDPPATGNAADPAIARGADAADLATAAGVPASVASRRSLTSPWSHPSVMAVPEPATTTTTTAAVTRATTETTSISTTARSPSKRSRPTRATQMSLPARGVPRGSHPLPLLRKKGKRTPSQSKEQRPRHRTAQIWTGPCEERVHFCTILLFCVVEEVTEGVCCSGRTVQRQAVCAG